MIIFTAYDSYDASGNRTQKTEQRTVTASKTITSTYNNMNQLVSSLDSSTNETTNYTYDVYGNLVNDGKYYYTYDAYYNRLISTTNLATNQITTYDYYVDGLRRSKNNTYYIWLDGNMVYEFTANDSTKYTYGYRLLYSDDTMFALNAHGDVTALFVETEYVDSWVDEFGNLCGNVYTITDVTKRYDYDAFGNELSIDNTDTNPFRYCGEYFDFETGQIYLRNRYYQPVTGRFSQLDPIRDGLNWYAYCANNPINFIDPNGLWQEGDELYPQWAQDAILYYTELYYSAENQSEKERAHQSAEAVRNLMKKYVPREQWGANDSQSDYWENDPVKDTIVIHHTNNEDSIQELDSAHIKRDLGGIAYHFVIGRDGTIYEGRPFNMKGSHVALANTGKIGVSLVGDYHNGFGFWDGSNEIPNEQLRALEFLLIILKDGQDISEVGGHRDYKRDTVCPGTELYGIVENYK